MLAREWLIEKGLAKGTRGRLSTAAREALATAIAAGTEFEDWNEEGKAEPEENYITPAKVNPHARAVIKATGEEISMRNACFTCSLSLYWCECETPLALGKRGDYQMVVLNDKYN